MATPQTSKTYQKNTTPNQGTTASTKKRYSVTTPREYESGGEQKTFWTTIGTAFEGPKGITIELNALPINGRMFINTQEKEQ